ncbi:MAG: 3-succinoylsemialdehyde-pyridine dehydrogenase [Pseudomonadales bacterium]|nr:3-succinoylsemialdehyde-pyridine dehydrogenase [Pseudomonadales bacterium]
MTHYDRFYIDGAWVEPAERRMLEVIDPSTEEAFAAIAIGSAADADRACRAARAAFPGFAGTSREERLALLERIVAIYQRRYQDFAVAISREMGAPMGLATRAQAAMAVAHFTAAIEALRDYPFEETLGGTRVFHEPIGVCALITPWNWPGNQIACKVAPALATGCTMVLKPSEIAPIDALLFAEVLHEAGVPPGVFNLVNGDGPGVGSALAVHPEVDMVSFTGSTRAGILVAKSAADTVKRVCQELGGKSANILLDDVDFATAVPRDVRNCFSNSGQSCNAPSRMLVPVGRMAEVARLAREAVATVQVGDPRNESTTMGPVVSRTQYERIQRLIQAGIDEGAELVCGGTGRPDGLDRGYYVKPTVFANVDNGMTIAREEIFGPVLSIIPYRDEADAIRIANDTVYGLSGYVSSADLGRARRVARALRTGMVHLNGAPNDIAAPFGGYRQSGNGREWGAHGFHDFLETKAVMGYEPE